MTKPTQAQIEANLKQWDEWYETLPSNLKSKLSISDFRRLGDNFYRIFVLQKPAAQVGEDKVVEGYSYGWRASFESTVERCAQMAENCIAEDGDGLDIPAAIRRLKDEP